MTYQPSSNKENIMLKKTIAALLALVAGAFVAKQIIRVRSEG
jgi:hypothetical protein